MGEEQIWIERRKGKVRIFSQDEVGEQNSSPNKNGEDQVPPNKEKLIFQRYTKNLTHRFAYFKKPTALFCLGKKNYMVTISFGLTASCMRRTKCVFDTGTGPNFLQPGLVERDYLASIRPCSSPWLNSAINQSVKVVRKIVLHVRIGGSHVRVMFEIVRNLADPVFLCTWLIDRFSKDIFPSYKEIFLSNSTHIPVLIVQDVESDKTEEEQDGTVANTMTAQAFSQELILVTLTTTVKPLSKTSVLVATNAKKIIQIGASTWFEEATFATRHVDWCICSREDHYDVFVANASTAIITWAKTLGVGTNCPPLQEYSILNVTSIPRIRYKAVQSKCTIQWTKRGCSAMVNYFTVSHRSQCQEERWLFSISCHWKSSLLTDLTNVWTVTKVSFTKKPACKTYQGSGNE